MSELLKELDYDPDRATVHGFRSTFKDWASERTNFSNEVSEATLWHAVADKVEAAYRRGELFEKRRKLMDVWASYCASRPASDAAVVGIRAAGQSQVNMGYCVHRVSLAKMLRERGGFTPRETLAAFYGLRAIPLMVIR